MNTKLNTAHSARHPRYVQAAFQAYLKAQGLRAPVRKSYAAWLSRFVVFHHGQALERLRPHHVDHYLSFLAMYADLSEQQQHEAHCCLSMFYQYFLPALQLKEQAESELEASG